MSDIAEDSRLIALSHLGLRRCVGVLGLALPILLLAGGLMFFDRADHIWGGSISAHYWAPHLRDLFVGTLCTIGVFLCFYQGYRREISSHYFFKGRSRVADWLARHVSDWWVTTGAGVGALITALVPTACPDCTCPTGTWLCPAPVIHWAGAAVFLGLLAWLSLFHFTRTRDAPQDWPDHERAARSRERWLHAALGGVMFLALGLIAVVIWRNIGTDPAPGGFGAVFWLEAVAVWAFGWSWLIKGKALHRLLGLTP